MFIELIDLLRCTRPHEDSWLVATFQELRERHVRTGLLSCPVCGARYEIVDGTAIFGGVAPATVPAAPQSEDDGVRVAAFLNLLEPGVVLLEGAWAGAASTLTRLGSTVIALNAPAPAEQARVSRVQSHGIVPLARECLDGIALASDDPQLVDSGARALKTGARMVAPSGARVPAGMTELARDGRQWIAVREGAGASAPVQIARR